MIWCVYCATAECVATIKIFILQVMEEFAFCIGKSSLEVKTTLTKNWNIWVPKIMQKAKLETSNRNTLFQNY